MKTIFLVLGCFLFSIFANASENPYIELAQPSDLMEIHVNTSQFNPKNGKVTKTEISFGDGTVVTNNSDVYHKYAATGNYTITVKIWTSLNGVSTYVKTIDVNPEYRVLPIANSTVFYNSETKNKKYSFSISALQAESLYKIKLTKIPDTPETTSSAASSRSCDMNLGVKINSIPLFKESEIDCNTTVVEKLVKLKTLNEIIYDMQQNKKHFSTEISAVEIVKDYTAPVIALSLSSGALTKENKMNITITDESTTTTYIWDNQQNLLFVTVLKNFEIPLVEGVNNFVIQAVDQYDNSSQYFQLTGVTRDSIPSALNAILNSEYIYASYPQNFTVTINSDEDLQSLYVNGILALWVAPRTYSYVLNVTSPGQINIELRAYDLAGNETVKTYQPIFNIDNVAPTVSTSLSNNVVTSQNSVRVTVVDNANTVTEVYKNGNLIKSTAEKEFEIFFENQGANSYVIKSRDAYNNEAINLNFDVTFDSVAPQITALTPEQNTIIHTNSLPFNIPVTVEVNEPVTTIAINSTIATMISSIKGIAEIPVLTAGPIVIRIETTDLAGNPTIIERTIIVEYSNVPPVLTLDASVKNMLTNKTEVRIFGTSNIKLATAKLNGASISVGNDGLSFSGFFSPPGDGRYRIEVVGTDLYGNIALVVGYVRILADLPEVFENYPTLTATPTETGHRIDYGPGFKQPHVGNACEEMKRIFEQKEEFAANLQQIQKREDEFLDQFPAGYEPDIPTKESLMNFIGQIDEPLNYVKAGYLAVCEGKIIMPETDCPQNREILKLLTGQYPEPMIIRSIPFIAPFIQDFLISRYNICTGLDTSGLSCEDMKSLLPLVANLTFPSVGQMMSSPIGKFVMDELMCKEICETPTYKDLPICKQAPLPQIPQLPGVTPVSFMPPNLDFPGLDLGLDDWGSGGGWGNGSSCGGWNKRCKSGGTGGRWKFGCQTFPQLPRCGGGNVADIFEDVEIDENVECPTAGWTLTDALNAQSPTNYMMSVLSKCSKNAVPGIPQINAPVITVTAPVQNQEASDTVRVIGFVDDAHALVRINGADVNTIPGIQGAHFDVSIATPTSGTVTVESANQWGEQAVPVSINLASLQVGHSEARDFFATGATKCQINVNGGLECWRYGYLGNGPHTSRREPVEEPVVVNGFESGVTHVAGGGGTHCAIKNKSVYCWAYVGFSTGESVDYETPILVESFGNDNLYVSVSMVTTCAVKINGSTFCAGINFFYMVTGIPANMFEFVPATQLPGLGPVGPNEVTHLQSAGANTCVIKNGGLICWGANLYGALGDGNQVSGSPPVQVQGMQSGVTDVGVGFAHSCAVKDGGVYCWGLNTQSVLGLGEADQSILQLTPTLIPTLSSGVSQIATWWASRGQAQSCALKNSRLYCWGNTYGPLPVDIGFDNVTSVIGGHYISAKSNGKIRYVPTSDCYGDDVFIECFK